MKDNYIKELLNKDTSVPKAPTHEWSNILNEIETSKRSHTFSLFSLGTLTATFCSFLIITVSLNQLNQKQNTIILSEQNVIQFLTEDNYLAQNQDSYSWVDSY